MHFVHKLHSCKYNISYLPLFLFTRVPTIGYVTDLYNYWNYRLLCKSAIFFLYSFFLNYILGTYSSDFCTKSDLVEKLVNEISTLLRAPAIILLQLACCIKRMGSSPFTLFTKWHTTRIRRTGEHAIATNCSGKYMVKKFFSACKFILKLFTSLIAHFPNFFLFQ